MHWFSRKLNFKVILSALSLCLIGLIFFINSWLIESLRESVKKTAINYQTFMQEIYSNEELDESTNNLFLEFVLQSDLPIVVKNKDGSIPAISSHFNNKGSEEIDQSILEMERIFDPLPLTKSLNNQVIFTQKLYYGDTDMIKIIKVVPYVQILIVFSLAVVCLMLYSSSRKNLQNALYVGIFKETAHQLGTPISSLMGWSENIKNKGYSKDIVEYMDEDIQKLRDASERFSKIGSKAMLEEVDLSCLLDKIIMYTKNRIPKTKKIDLETKYVKGILTKGDEVLLSWAFENIIKNAIQAINKDYGKIKIVVNKVSSKLEISFSDTGKGVPRSEWRKIFFPGYSTKNRGWGVGLSLTQRIIEQIHSGKIYVSSSSKKGTTIKVSI